MNPSDIASLFKWAEEEDKKDWIKWARETHPSVVEGLTDDEMIELYSEIRLSLTGCC